MSASECLIDSDTLSELSRGNVRVVRLAREYLVDHGRLAFSAVTVFERLRGYRDALADGKPYEPHLEQFERLCQVSKVLPVDAAVADRAARYWPGLSRTVRRSLGDILIAATASVHQLVLVTRNRRDFEPIQKLDPGLELRDWSR